MLEDLEQCGHSGMHKAACVEVQGGMFINSSERRCDISYLPQTASDDAASAHTCTCMFTRVLYG